MRGDKAVAPAIQALCRGLDALQIIVLGRQPDRIMLAKSVWVSLA